MEVFTLLFFITLFLIGALAITEVVQPGAISEGFANSTRTSYWSQFTSPRSDLGPDQEDATYIRDPRYFNDYTDVSRMGVSYDFCRVIATREEPNNRFFACGLAGTDGTDSAKFRTPSEEDGFRLSLDDYMRDINNDGRADYCRILKWKDGTWQAVCNRATDLGFDAKEIVDPNPPEETSLLLRMYQDCVIWLRMFGDLHDYVKQVEVRVAGGLQIEEEAQRKTTKGVTFLGGDQFLRIADASDLTLGSQVPLRSIRAWMVWVKFDEFTNNAKIFDFGNGAGRDNVFLGILGKGDSEVESNEIRSLLCGKGDETIPSESSGAQPVVEVPPAELMKTTDANVDEYTCVGFDVAPRRLPPSSVSTPITKKVETGKATMLFEIWDQQSRKMRIKVPSAIPKGKWTHICITTKNMDAMRPDYQVYINGRLRMEKENGWLPATSSMTNCYIGKSNWTNASSLYEDRDEAFRGSLFDFRAYRRNISEDLVIASHDWGKAKLELSPDQKINNT